METRVGILAIGNEVVEGQITNRNAAWLSEQLDYMGAQPLFHLSCRDEHQEITDALNFLGKHCHLILVSGGLGPTKDDFTRQSLSEWLKAPLEHNADQWRVIEDKIKSRGLTVREGHRNQALIPKGAQPLANSNGVAPGFAIKAESCFLAALPGPPYELQAMFKNELKPYIEQNLAPQKQKTLHTFICLGAPESEVAHITESLLGDEFEVGFRLHKPYVEVKVWTAPVIDRLTQQRFELLKSKLNPWYVGESIRGIREKFHTHLKKFDNVFVIDHLTSGLFLEKLKEDFKSDHLRYQCFEHNAFRHFSKSEVEAILKHMQIENTPNSLFISLFPQSDHSALLSFNNEIRTVNLPKRIPVSSMLGQLYSLERAFLWNQNG